MTKTQQLDTKAVAAWLAAQPTPADTRPAAEPIDVPPMTCGSVPQPATP